MSIGRLRWLVGVAAVGAVLACNPEEGPASPQPSEPEEATPLGPVEGPEVEATDPAP